MAGYECSLCSGDEQATLLVTPLTGGETMAVGQDCMAVALTGMLAGTLGLDAEKLAAAIERLTRAQAKQAAKGDGQFDPVAAQIGTVKEHLQAADHIPPEGETS